MVVREVAEESGITIVLIGFAGVYSDRVMSWSTQTAPSTSSWHCAFTPFPQRPTRAANHVQTA